MSTLRIDKFDGVVNKPNNYSRFVASRGWLLMSPVLFAFIRLHILEEYRVKFCDITGVSRKYIGYDLL